MDSPDTDEHVTGGEEDDGSLRVLEPPGVDQERAHCDQGDGEADDGPRRQPRLGELPLLLAEVGRLARDGAVEHSPCRHLLRERG